MGYVMQSEDLAAWKLQFPNFSPVEVGCRGCAKKGKCRNNPFAIDLPALAMLQQLREIWGGPLTINSAYRCAWWNSMVGGSTRSHHKIGDAFDISIRGMSADVRLALYENAKAVGFSGFGFYGTFLHVDTGRVRTWFTTSGRKTWSFLETS